MLSLPVCCGAICYFCNILALITLEFLWYLNFIGEFPWLKLLKLSLWRKCYSYCSWNSFVWCTEPEMLLKQIIDWCVLFARSCINCRNSIFRDVTVSVKYPIVLRTKLLKCCFFFFFFLAVFLFSFTSILRLFFFSLVYCICLHNIKLV